MSANSSAATAAIANSYSAPELLGLMTLSLIIALLLIGFATRLVKTMSAVRNYEVACEKLKEIEIKLEEMTRAHAKECFDLEQIIFDRNNELIDIKNKLLKFNLNGPV